MGQQSTCCAQKELLENKEFYNNAADLRNSVKLNKQQPATAATYVSPVEETNVLSKSDRLQFEIDPDVREKLKNLIPYKLKRPATVAHGDEIRPLQRIEQLDCYYAGEWKESKLHGTGTLFFPDGSIYTGTFVNSVATGQGRYIYTNGSYYEGDIIDNLACGLGKYYDENQEYLYEGQWLADKPHGKGTQTFKHGSHYIGTFKEGKKHGHGKYVSSTGAVYEGEFRNGQFEGEGKFVWQDKRTFVGQWEAGQMHGHGVFTWPDGNRYEGEYVNSKKQGRGTFYWGNGKIFQGMWHDGHKHGKGELIMKNGRRIQGEWVQGNILLEPSVVETSEAEIRDREYSRD